MTTIVGPSDAGKSAIVRALRLAALNRPNGALFVRHGTKACEVTVTTDKGTVVRKKGKGVNSYTVDGKVYAAFGNGVPAEVETVLNLSPDNFQRQLDLHFWFADSGGQVSRKLNEIVNLDLIDKSLAKAASAVRTADEKYESVKSEYLTAKREVWRLKWVERIGKELTQVERLLDRYRDKSRKASELRLLLAPLSRLRRDAGRLLNAKLAGENAMSAGARLRGARAKRKDLQKLLSEVNQASRLAKMTVPDFSTVQQLRKSGDEIAERRADLEALLEDITKAKEEVTSWQAKLEVTTSTLRKLSKDKCPTCGQPVRRPSSSRSLTYTSHSGRR